MQQDHLILLDLLSEPGHKNFNEFATKKISQECKLVEIYTKPTFMKCLLRYKGIKAIPYTVSAFFYSWYVLYKLRNKNIVILSYSLPALAIASRLVKFAGKIYVFEHNTFVPGNSIKLKLFKLINRRIKHLTFESYIAERIKEYNKEVYTFEHPVVSIPVSGKDIDFLMLSSTANQDDIDNLFEHLTKLKKLSYIKDKNNLNRSNEYVKVFSFLEDYYGYIARAKSIVILQKFDYRVSGVFYDAVKNVDIIYMKNSLFAINMKFKFPDKVKVFNTVNEII